MQRRQAITPYLVNVDAHNQGSTVTISYPPEEVTPVWYLLERSTICTYPSISTAHSVTSSTSTK